MYSRYQGPDERWEQTDTRTPCTSKQSELQPVLAKSHANAMGISPTTKEENWTRREAKKQKQKLNKHEKE